jgi:hypothetical protein
MKKKLTIIVALLAVILFLPVGQDWKEAGAAEINVLPYFALGPENLGESWTYTVTPPVVPDFTVNLTQITSGPFAGKSRFGDLELGYGTEWLIFDQDATGITFYELGSEGVFVPPGKINALQTLDEVLNFPTPDYPVNYIAYEKPGSSLTVPAGTFGDLLLLIFLEEDFGPNSANTLLDLDPVKIPYSVNSAVWFAAGIGFIQFNAWDPSTGTLVYNVQLEATSIPLPPSLLFLGSGLLGLIGWRRIMKN